MLRPGSSSLATVHGLFKFGPRLLFVPRAGRFCLGEYLLIKRLIGVTCVAALTGFLSLAARAESGDLNIDGTWVHVEIDHDRDVATFSNSCGTQVLTHQELEAGAKPDDIIPCPQRSEESAQCQQVKSDYDYQMNDRPVSAAWVRAAACIPGLMCDATCRDFDEYERTLEEKSALERKWVFQCDGFLTLGNGEQVDQSNFDAHHDEIYQDFRQRKQQVCEAERTAALEQERHRQQERQAAAVPRATHVKSPDCDRALRAARSQVRVFAADAERLMGLRQIARDSCSGVAEAAVSLKEVDAELSKAIAAAQAQTTGATPSAKKANRSAANGTNPAGGTKRGTPSVVAAAPSAAPSSPPAAASPKGAHPKFPVSSSSASSLPPWQRWMVTGSPADCAAARALDKTTAGWYDVCVPVARRGSSSAGPAGKTLKTVAPDNRNPAAKIPVALTKLLQSLPQGTGNSDDGRECGHRSGHRARGRCFAPWDGNNREACETDLGGTYYPASGDDAASFCAYDADANPLTAADRPQEGESCGDAGGHIHGGACWALGITRSDCDDLHGQIVENGGYQYCAYDAMAAAQTAAAPGPKQTPDDLRGRLRNSLNAAGDASTDTSDDSAQAGPQTASTPQPAATPPAPQRTAQKTMTPQEARKACAALGSHWRYDPTATYNFSLGAPPKCFPIFTDSLKGEPGFQQTE